MIRSNVLNASSDWQLAIGSSDALFLIADPNLQLQLVDYNMAWFVGIFEVAQPY
jgi:hypothetical protein